MSKDSDAAAHALIRAWHEENKGDELAGLPADWPVAVWEVLVRDFPKRRCWAAHSPNVPEPVLRRLAADDDFQVRSRVAEKRKLPPDLFEVMARDSSESVRKAIASNAKAPPHACRACMPVCIGRRHVLGARRPACGSRSLSLAPAGMPGAFAALSAAAAVTTLAATPLLA